MKAQAALKWFVLLFFILLGGAALTLVFSEPVQSYIEAVKKVSLAPQDKDPLLTEIVALSQSIDEKPINARLDRVWKLIPGYNGIEVDVPRSYALAKKLGRVDLRNLVIKEVEPEINLDDLPPAAIYRGNPKKPAVALMINVAWGTEHLEPILDILGQYQVRATFFLDGKWLERNKEMASKLLREGHELGNHAYSHPDLRKMSMAEIRMEIGKTEELIRQLGTRSLFFAPPAGAYDDRVVEVARQLNMYTVMWTLDTVDWKNPAPEEIVTRIVPRLENGALILMHPTLSTVQALPAIIEGALNKGMELGTVSEVLSTNRTISVEPLN